jgi:SpoIID/LytB domain protein
MRARMLAGSLALFAGMLVPPTPAVAAITVDQVFPVPANGVFDVVGHGWGHGIGLNQWGADGAAQQGKTADQILAAYFPGTVDKTVANSDIRVWLTEADTNELVVPTASKLEVQDLATRHVYALPTHTGLERWRITVASGREQVSWWDGSAWHLQAFGTATSFKGPVQFQGPATIGLFLPDGTERLYRGDLRGVASSSSTLSTVNVLPMDDYLYGVVPREVPGSWPAAALQAQAVAARSYALYDATHQPAGSAWDICDNGYCQEYAGYAVVSGGQTTVLEEPSTNAAVNVTAGEIRAYGGAPILAMYSASNGGYEVAGGEPYLPARPDPWDQIASPVHTWTARISAAQLQAAFPAVGRLLRVVVTERDGNGEWGGRVLAVTLQGVDATGHATSVATTGEGVYLANPWPQSADGLLGTWWEMSDVPPPMAAGTGPAAVVDAHGTPWVSYESNVRTTVYLAGFPGGGWSGPSSYTVGLTEGPALGLTGGSATVYAPVRYGRLYDRVLDGTTGWHGIGGTSTSAASIVDQPHGSVTVFARGSAGQVVSTHTVAGGWASWTSLGGDLPAGSAPAATVAGSGSVDLFAVDSSGELTERKQSGTGWSGWSTVGVSAAHGVAAVSPATGVVLVAVVQSGGTVLLAVDNGGVWGAWHNLGSGATGAPALAVGAGRVWLFTGTSSGAIRMRTAKVGSYGSWTGWTAVT